MKKHLAGRTWRVVMSLAAAAMVVSGSIPLARAAGPTKQVAAERAVGGLTIAEQVARQQALHAEVSPQIPAGVENAPVRIDLTKKDLEELAVHAPPGTAPLRVGVVKPIPYVVGHPVGGDFQRGLFEEHPDGSFVWAVQVTSPGAQALRVHLTEFFLPAGAEMVFIGPNGQADGPYVARGRDGNGDFWTRSIVSESGAVVVRYEGTTPDAALARMSFVISEVAHIHGRPPRPQEQSHDSWPCSDNAPCLVDVNCINTGPAAPAENAVAKMEWIQGAYIYSCTGGLLADTDGSSQIPYFLTANHCLSSSNSNLETFFNYTTDSCDGSCPDSLVTGGTPPPASTVGVTLVATARKGDFTLLTLNQGPPSGSTFLGWNNTPIANAGGTHLYRISNPNFGPQVYSQHDVDASSPTCIGWPRGERIYSTDVVGATMGGSSGSPVLNSSSEVVGQLSGCCGYDCGNECDSANNWTVDGALAYYWDSVAPYLDPPGGGCTTDAECDDGQFCTGTETCVGGSCQSSGNPCTGGTICNESTNTCDSTATCDNDGTCEAGEDCLNCPNDCRQQSTGNPNNRYCCDGDLTDCGDSRCSESGWNCGGGSGGCTANADCDDGLFCNGTETCSGGACQAGSDPCPGECDESTDSCVACGGNKAACSANSDCCSNTCKNGTCRGN